MMKVTGGAGPPALVVDSSINRWRGVSDVLLSRSLDEDWTPFANIMVYHYTDYTRDDSTAKPVRCESLNIIKKAFAKLIHSLHALVFLRTNNIKKCERF